MNKKIIFAVLFSIIFILGCVPFRSGGAEKETTGKAPLVPREFRAVWVATVANIDWPSQPGLPVERQKQEALAILDTVQKLNMNAVIFQVRPQCDAFYQSDLEPWSYYLTGTQGEAPEPFYDPLAFWVEEAHKRGLELHAWFNPYRAHHPKGGPVSEASIVRRKPTLVKKLANGYYWLDPANKETRAHSTAVIMDVVRRYDIDGVHLDDYFYPYPSYNNGKEFPDEDSWEKYRAEGGTLKRKDWRRWAVNRFIETLYRKIKKEKPRVQFGISPFGLYRPGLPPSVSGFDQYDVLYADARLWLREGWLDYFTPQLYWPINQMKQSFPVLLGWWTRENKKKRHVWPGIAAHKMNNAAGTDELVNEIMISRGFTPQDPGQVFFSMKLFMDTSAVLNKALLEGPYRKPALAPASPWLDKEAPAMPAVQALQQEDTLTIKRDFMQEKDLFRWVVCFRYGTDSAYQILNKNQSVFKLPFILYEKETGAEAKLDAVSVYAVDRSGNESAHKQLFSAGHKGE